MACVYSWNDKYESFINNYCNLSFFFCDLLFMYLSADHMLCVFLFVDKLKVITYLTVLIFLCY